MQLTHPHAPMQAHPNVFTTDASVAAGGQSEPSPYVDASTGFEDAVLAVSWIVAVVTVVGLVVATMAGTLVAVLG